MSDAIEFFAQVFKVQTIHQDNTIRVTLDLNEGETVTMAKLAECARFGLLLTVTMETVKLTESNDEAEKGTEASPARMGRRRLTKRRDQPASQGI